MVVALGLALGPLLGLKQPLLEGEFGSFRKRREEREEKKREWSERQEIMKLKEYLLVIDVSHTVSFKVKAF